MSILSKTHNEGFPNLIDSAIARVALECSRADNALRLLTGSLPEAHPEAQVEERKCIDRELSEKLSQELDMLAVDLGLLLCLVPRGAPALIESIFRLGRRAEALRNAA